ncbi:MAG: hypothetical protein DMF64_13905 [Acidobacteria bacterium]|nr:MAG: hypothetical protein DMF64_13905 [Acidobacteriota bacterium]
MTHSSSTTLTLRGVFIPLWLLTRPEIEHGAKLVYVLLAQKAGIKGAAKVYIPALAAELGDEETQVNEFLTALESCGLIKIQNRRAAAGVLQCVFPAHPWAGGVEAAERGAGETGRRSGPPKSRHSRETCIQFAMAKQEAGENIRNVHALATYFYKAGDQDEEIDIFLSRSEMPVMSPPDVLSDVQ